MASGLFSGKPGLNLGTGLYRAVAGLWSGAAGLLTGFGGTPAPPVTMANVLSANGTSYAVGAAVLSSSGGNYTVTNAVKSAAGVTYTVI